MDIKKRIEKLRHNMKKAGVYGYFIPTSDFHGSEYINDYFKVREYFTGFTGSAGTLLVTQKESCLWVDGRYYLQAEQELMETDIKLMKAGMTGVPSVTEYIKKEFPEKAILGFDGRTVDLRWAKLLKKALPSKKIRYKNDLTEGIFERGSLPQTKIKVLSDDITGESSIDKISSIRAVLKKEGCDAIFLTKLDEIAYLFNIRANDIAYNPVALAYAYITEDKAFIFLRDDKAETGYPASLLKNYNEINSFLAGDNVCGKVMADPEALSYTHYKLIKKRAEVIRKTSPVIMMKAVKNAAEISHLKEIYYWDSLQLTRFIRWISTTDTEETEVSAAEKLTEFRRHIPEFNDLSFETISAYGENAAIIHYSPSDKHETKIEKRGMLMVDSGGQYTGGTTDVTRTIVMGDITDEEKEAFTDVAVSMLKLMNVHFKKGTTGVNLDILARERMWKRGIDYKHGTGHGIGYMLNVHEGPQAIRSKYTDDQRGIVPGMLVSDEPGIYIAGKFGVRTENILLAEEDQKTPDGEFYRFHNLTEVPIDDRGIDYRYMDSGEIEMYESYQRNVYESLSKKMTEEEKRWLYEYSGLSRINKGE